MGQMDHYLIGKRNLTIPETRWENLDSGFRVTKPTVFCFGGNMSLTIKDANYMCKVAQNLVGIKNPIATNEIASNQNVDFVGVAYGADRATGFGKNRKTSDTGTLTDEEINELVNSIFTPLYMDDRMQRRSVEQILKNFNQITFFAHCHGAVEINRIVRQVRTNMRAIGIDAQTVDAALEQVFAVSYAPEESVECAGLQVVLEKDKTITCGPDHANIAIDFLEKRHRYPGTGTVAYKENKNTISLIVTDMTANEFDEHDIELAARDTKWRIKGEDVMFRDDVSKAMGVALSYSIASGIQNQRSATFTPKLTADEMLQKVQSILGETQNDEFAAAIKDIQAEESGRER